ncbi:hypothetical protein Q9Q94_17745 [Uliginosibacterium sp. 31-16]|uniref:hypothetical protein n=1 Tax=Uliginosibacterium sp. 31-16 TaxID=3068315 RepID=UPI00273FA462|nr:hypothetical protein [Uliginosibacterium sp. 31-16]MDP5241382.1 hypothetical protein [Uliginosibacterium sp. 31-16]
MSFTKPVIASALVLASGFLLSACGGGGSSDASRDDGAATGCTATVVGSVQSFNLGTTAPPTSMGGYTMQAFDQTAQNAVANFANVTTIPGSPIGGNLTLAASATKRTVPGGGWATWSHSYTGVVYYTASTTNTLTLPAGTAAFYLYAEPNSGTVAITATTDSGASSGPISVVGTSGANGFGFAAPCGSTISTITVTQASSDFAIGEFGIAQ